MLSINTNKPWFVTHNQEQSLDNYVEELFDKVQDLPERSNIRMKGIITPHAEIIYSGYVSATMYTHLISGILALKDNPKHITLVILCANHYQQTNKFIVPAASFINFNDVNNFIPINRRFFWNKIGH